MGYYVHIHVAFACDSPDGMKDLAAHHLALLEKKEEAGGLWEAKQMLTLLAEGKGIQGGPKGALFLWGMIGNYTDDEVFVNCLRPFWEDLLSEHGEDWGGPLPFEHILIFVEKEQREHMDVWEISRKEEKGKLEELVIKKHERLPFCAYQI